MASTVGHQANRSVPNAPCLRAGQQRVPAHPATGCRPSAAAGHYICRICQKRQMSCRRPAGSRRRSLLPPGRFMRQGGPPATDDRPFGTASTHLGHAREELRMTSHPSSSPDGQEPRRSAVRALLAPLSEPELRIFVDYLAQRELMTVELALADFLAIRATVIERPTTARLAGAWLLVASRSCSPVARKSPIGCPQPVAGGPADDRPAHHAHISRGAGNEVGTTPAPTGARPLHHAQPCTPYLHEPARIQARTRQVHSWGSRGRGFESRRPDRFSNAGTRKWEPLIG
jgi:hypothetical protein